MGAAFELVHLVSGGQRTTRLSAQDIRLETMRPPSQRCRVACRPQQPRNRQADDLSHEVVEGDLQWPRAVVTHILKWTVSDVGRELFIRSRRTFAQPYAAMLVKDLIERRLHRGHGRVLPLLQQALAIGGKLVVRRPIRISPTLAQRFADMLLIGNVQGNSLNSCNLHLPILPSR